MATPWRTAPLPADWATDIRPPILERDGHQCTWTRADGTRCTETTQLEVDHLGDPDDHRPHMLRTLCRHHHRRRTAIQANEAQGPRPSRARPAEQHPGLRRLDRPPF
ncbi:HNH endonuclease [Streptomyces sp. NPDC048507]|uniref:HNH endonuclease n=1 Tax=Streptomyces sp. NPDC048507 TaxID=3365560 RepID=UPI0037192191